MQWPLTHPGLPTAFLNLMSHTIQAQLWDVWDSCSDQRITTTIRAVSYTHLSGGPTYSESDGTFSTDDQGNRVYTDAMGNTTTNTEQYNYTDESGNIITDGYGYIDPYTGAYIIK